MTPNSFNHYWLSIQNRIKQRDYKSSLPLLLRRNKGFFLRKAISRSNDLLEFLFFALIAAPDFLKPILQIFVFFFFVDIISEWLLITSKEMALEKERFSKSFSVSYLAFIHFICLISYLYYRGAESFTFIDGIFLYKMLAQTVQSYTLYKTLDHQSQIRTYVPLWKTSSPFILSQLIAWGTYLFSENLYISFVTGLFTFSSAVLAADYTYYHLIKRRDLFSEWKKPILPLKEVSIIKGLYQILLNNSYILDLLFISILYSGPKLPLFYLLTSLAAVFRIIIRPYRALLLDFQKSKPNSLFRFYLKSQTLIVAIIFTLVIASFIITTKNKDLIFISTLLFLKQIFVIHTQRENLKLASVIVSGVSFALISISDLLTLSLNFLFFIFSILTYFKRIKSTPKVRASFLIPVDVAFAHKRINIQTINYHLMKEGVELRKIILKKYLLLSIDQDGINEKKSHIWKELGLYLDNSKEIIPLSSLPGISLEILKDKDFLIINNGMIIKKKGHWPSETLSYLSHRSRLLSNDIIQLSKAALFTYKGQYFYLLTLATDEILIISSPEFTDSELEQLDMIKLKSLE